VAVDGIGKVVIGSAIDERGLRVFPGNLNEAGGYAASNIKVTKILEELMTITATLEKTGVKNLMESLTITYSIAREFYKTLAEPFRIVATKHSHLTRTISVDMLLHAAANTKLNRVLYEQITITPDYFKRFYIYMPLQHVVITATRNLRQATANKYETLRIRDTKFSEVRRSLSEALVIADTHRMNYGKVFYENVKITVSSNTVTKIIFLVPVIISTSYAASVRFVMKNLGTKMAPVYNKTTTYSSKSASMVRMAIKNTQLRMAKTKARFYPVHKNPQVTLEDGRDLK